MQDLDLTIPSLGTPKYPSPLKLSTTPNDHIADFTSDVPRVIINPIGPQDSSTFKEQSFELAGPRQINFFKGDDVIVGIVTCGGLSPGMNNVIRGLVLQLWYAYGVRKIYGYRYGFLGLTLNSIAPPTILEPDIVKDIDLLGGTILGSSRGPQDPQEMLDTLLRHKVNILFTIGGDGTMRATLQIYQEVSRRKIPMAIIGVPKTIDNDIPYIERTFGYDTAVSNAASAIRAAHVEAIGAPNGVGLVKLMGRHAGFIAASATLATREVNVVLIPELPFDLHGEKGLLQYLRHRIQNRGHALIVVAEGAGQQLLPKTTDRDLSGNPKLGDIGVFLCETINHELKDLNISLKYIDPSYIIRAAPANPQDAIFCGQLSEDAVHAGMAGKTGMVVGLWHNYFTHVPLPIAARGGKTISLDSNFWRNVIDSTGQPPLLRND